MSREDFRRDLRGAFESISGPSSPSLSARVHEALVEAPERRGPVWLAGVAVAVVAVLLVGILFVAGPLSHRQILPLVPGASPSPSPSAVVQHLGPFNCGTNLAINALQPSSNVVFVDGVRTGTHTGYDRITIEFQNGQPPTVEIQSQGTTTFTQGASGQQVVLQGSKGLLVTIHSADEHTAYTGSTDLKTGYNGLVEARQVQDFEGTVQWGLGLEGSGCYRAFFMTGPDRLVIDVQTG
jgi:hypothetical protein